MIQEAVDIVYTKKEKKGKGIRVVPGTRHTWVTETLFKRPSAY